MKISSGASQSLNQAQAQSDTKNIKNNKAENKSAAIDSALSAQVSLSDEAQQIKKATEIAKDDTVNETKVAYFQNLIDNGKYKIDSASVADKLVDDHMKMPS
jgi:flagellar biosynthesis anti-sigma factor FlgM